jgi:hydrogenase small subunit
MQVSRRSFLKYCIGSAAVLGLDLPVLGALEKALAAGGGPPVIWLSAAGCSGCTVSLANLAGETAPTDVADLLVNTIDLAFHQTLMGAAGDLAVATLREAAGGSYILAVEGGVPTAFGGRTCTLWTEGGREFTALEAVRALAPSAAAVLAIGTCAAYGGIPGGKPNPTGVQSVGAAGGRATVNIPGCPTHPDWIVWTIARLLAGKAPRLDSAGRPLELFGSTVHERCPRRNRGWALGYGEEGACLQGLGCKGPATRADCPTRGWNAGTSWCVGANSLCLGCTDPAFPDRFSPFYGSAGVLPGDHERTDKQCIRCHDGKPGDDDDDEDDDREDDD